MPKICIQFLLPSSLCRMMPLLFCLLMVLSFPDKALADTSPTEIRVLIEDNYPPYIMHDANNSLSGYLVDI